jgi:hypothetical protein
VSIKSVKGRIKAKTRPLTEVDLEINAMVNLGKIRAAINEQYGTVRAYCLAYDITEQEMSRFLGKKCPITLRALWKHCKNLGITYRLTLTSEVL